MANVFRTIRNLFSRNARKPINAPKVPIGGHRGIAAGSIADPNLESYAGRVATGHEKIGEEESTDFLGGGNPIFVNSSNVIMVQFFPETNQMMVEFKGGGAYLYDGVSTSEAVNFLQAQSKGSWVWDHLRVRGSRTAHKKPYRKISSGYRPPQRKETAEQRFKREMELQRSSARQDVADVFDV